MLGTIVARHVYPSVPVYVLPVSAETAKTASTTILSGDTGGHHDTGAEATPNYNCGWWVAKGSYAKQISYR